MPMKTKTTRADNLGRAYAGSQLQIQIYINRLSIVLFGPRIFKRVPRAGHALAPVVRPDAKSLDEALPAQEEGQSHAQIEQLVLVKMFAQSLVEHVFDPVAVLEQSVSQALSVLDMVVHFFSHLTHKDF